MGKEGEGKGQGSIPVLLFSLFHPWEPGGRDTYPFLPRTPSAPNYKSVGKPNLGSQKKLTLWYQIA